MEVETTLALSTCDYKGPFYMFTTEQIKHEHGRSYEDIISDASDIDLGVALSSLCSALSMRFPNKSFAEGQKYAWRLLKKQPVQNGKSLLDYLKSIAQVRSYYQGDEFNLTLHTNFFQLREDLGAASSGFEKFAEIKRNGWWANGANYLLYAQLYHFTSKLDHFTLSSTVTAAPGVGIKSQHGVAGPAAKRQERNKGEGRRGVIYKLTCRDSGMSYIGQTLRDVLRRFTEHSKAFTLIGKALRRFGVDSFDIEILMVVDVPAADIDLEEAFFIMTHNTVAPNGYNGSVGNNQVHATTMMEEYKHNRKHALMLHPSKFTPLELLEYKTEVQKHVIEITRDSDSCSRSSIQVDNAESRVERANMLKRVHPDKTGRSIDDDDVQYAMQKWKTR